MHPKTNLFGQKLAEKASSLRYTSEALEKRYASNFRFSIEGCNELEINKLAENQKVGRLPSIYHSFMLHFGKYCGDIYIGYDITYNYHFEYNFKDNANQILVDDGINSLTDNDYVFMTLQAMSFWYFDVTHDDPPVYMYIPNYDEGQEEKIFQNGAVIISPKLSFFLTEFISKREGEEHRRKFLEELNLI